MDNDKFETIKRNFKNNLIELKKDLDKYLMQISEIAKDFGGPSIYFHNRALQEIKNNYLGVSHIEMIYAVLPSWGMHRMGDTSTKIINFDKFTEQIDNNREILHKLKDKTISEIKIEAISNLLINNLSFSESNSHLVSSSKVLHHIIPNLVSPIDKQYSIRFLLQPKNKFLSNTKNGKIKYSQIAYNNKEEIKYSNLFLSGMHSFIEDNKSILINYLDKEIDFGKNFNTSLTKIFDNLIMVYIKDNSIREYGV